MLQQNDLVRFEDHNEEYKCYWDKRAGVLFIRAMISFGTGDSVKVNGEFVGIVDSYKDLGNSVYEIKILKASA